MQTPNYNIKENKTNAKELHKHCAVKAQKRNDCSGLAINGSFPEEVIFVLGKVEGKYCRWKKWHEEREWRRTHPEFGQDWNLECLEGCG